MLDLKETALGWARAGYAVFPVIPGGKTPLIAGGHNMATTDEKRVSDWWTLTPSANIGASPSLSGHCVIDTDPPTGDANLTELENEHGRLPDTFTVRTPRGGRHLWFCGELPSSVGRLAKHVDTRGIGGYVLLPGSRTEAGPYSTETDIPEAPLPSWVRPTLALGAKPSTPAALETLDLPANVSRAVSLLSQYVASNDVAVQGSGADDRTYRLACEVLNLGISPEKANELILDIWYPHCSPNTKPDFVSTKVESAAKYAQNEAGAWAVQPASEIFKDYVPEDLPVPEVRERRITFDIRSEEQQDNVQPPEWIIDQMIPKNSTILASGQYASGKSFFAVDVALSIAAGTEYFGQQLGAAPVLYAAHEGRTGIMSARRPAWKIARQVGGPVPFYVSRAPLFAMPGNMDTFIEEIKASGIKPALIVLDTMAKCMAGMDENSAKDCGIAVAACDRLKEELGCSVLVLDHDGKEGGRGPRGSTAKPAGFDTVLSISMDRASKAMSVTCTKQKDADERETPWTMALRPVGASAVLFEIKQDEYREMTHIDSLVDRKKVGSTLRTLGAVSEANAVALRVIAEALTPHTAGESAEARESAVDVTERAMARAAKHGGPLAGYFTPAGWWLPA